MKLFWLALLSLLVAATLNGCVIAPAPCCYFGGGYYYGDGYYHHHYWH